MISRPFLDLSVMDALPVTASLHVGTTELVTTESLQKPVNRSTDIQITSI